MFTSEQKIKEITKKFYERLASFDADSFVHKIKSISEHLDLTYQSLLKQYDSRIFFGDTVEPIELSEYEYNSFHLMKIIALVTEELHKNQDSHDRLHNIITVATNKSDLPAWLKERVISYMPLLLLKEYSQDESSQSIYEEYIVITQDGFNHMTEAALDTFRKKNKPESFDIFIENTDFVNISIQNRDKLFRAGNYHPFNILTLFLQRLGQSLSYQEIYHLAIIKAEKTIPQNHSKKVYDYLKIIKETIQKSEEVDIDPDRWFQRDPQKGIVHISKSINSCLVTTKQNLFI